MNKAQRLLTIYTRLINNQGINKINLADELEVDERTIQRDIDDIRNYLFSNEEYQQSMEVIYQYNSNEYKLLRHEILHDSSTFSLLIMHLKNHTSVITRDIYDLLKSIIYKFYSHDTRNLLEQINQFHVIDNSIITMIPKIQAAIMKQHTVSFKYNNEKIVGVPVDITSWHSQYALWLNKNKQQFHLDKIKHLKIIDSENTVSEKVVLTMTKDVWHILKNQYSVDIIENISDDQITVTFNMTYPETLSVCILYSPHIMLISPSYMHQSLVKFLLATNAVYMNKQILNCTRNEEVDNEDKK
ncbi:helix-turn-helix transcriptional regulator [Macrococcus capreoli]|uniref:helix-turn-helix transcriptional regulator n=1 Tax=Macrococcus capreoli TaxID=2982690 RepID=UPI0021D58768|nr:HTH domain-containing protein [Macrococcus sp. TMW 2.2395]MCU7557956.1 HTH domain-containing protein [Macrococcus sp. TMW 2.2395]